MNAYATQARVEALRSSARSPHAWNQWREVHPSLSPYIESEPQVTSLKGRLASPSCFRIERINENVRNSTAV